MTSSESKGAPPYYVLQEKESHHARALFQVPSALLQHLLARPILCRGGSFTLTMDKSSSYEDDDYVFLECYFESPDPEEVAMEISKRLGIRIQDHESLTEDVGSSMFLNLF